MVQPDSSKHELFPKPSKSDCYSKLIFYPPQSGNYKHFQVFLQDPAVCKQKFVELIIFLEEYSSTHTVCKFYQGKYLQLPLSLRALEATKWANTNECVFF